MIQECFHVQWELEVWASGESGFSPDVAAAAWAAAASAAAASAAMFKHCRRAFASQMSRLL